MVSWNRESHKGLSLLVKNSLRLLTKKHLVCNSNIKIEGVIAITVDDKDVFVIHMNEVMHPQDMFPVGNCTTKSSRRKRQKCNSIKTLNCETGVKKARDVKRKEPQNSITPESTEAGSTELNGACSADTSSMVVLQVLPDTGPTDTKPTPLIQIDPGIQLKQQTCEPSLGPYNGELNYVISNIPFQKEVDEEHSYAFKSSTENEILSGTETDISLPQPITLIPNVTVLSTEDSYPDNTPSTLEQHPAKQLSASAIRGIKFRQKWKESPELYKLFRQKESERYQRSRLKPKTPTQMAKMRAARRRTYYRKRLAQGLPLREDQRLEYELGIPIQEETEAAKLQAQEDLRKYNRLKSRESRKRRSQIKTESD